MKPFKKSFLTIFLFSLLTPCFFAQTNLKGRALCNELYDFLQEKKLHLQIQPLTAGSYNQLPYNIIVTFTPKNIKSEHNLIILLEIEDAVNNKELLPPVFELLDNKDFNSTVVFCYESRIILPRDNLIYGCDVFVQSLNTNYENAVYIFDLSAKKNAIVSGSNGYHSPSWMLKAMFDAFGNAKVTDGLPIFFLSQMADFTFSTDRRLLSFLESEIPCISADIKNKQKAEEIILNCINLYDNLRFEPDDSHAFMFRLFGKRIWFSEYMIVSTLIILIVLGFLFVFIAGFVNRTLRKEFWQEIRSNWYVILVMYVLSVAGFFAGKGLYSLFHGAGNGNYTVFGCTILQISLSMLFVSVFFMLNLSLLKKYTTRSLDFILVIDTFINQVIFTLLDVSLFPIFLLFYLISVISFIFRRNWIHIILFVCLLLPFIPYINALFTISDSEKLHNMLINSKTLPLLLSLVLLPVYLMWLRILNAIKKRYPKKRVYALVISANYLLIFFVVFILNRVFYSNKKAPAREITVIPLSMTSASYDFSLSYTDKSLFSDTIRSIKLSSEELPLYAGLWVYSQNDLQPVLYSENDYINTGDGQVLFPLPLYPPKDLTFNYGTGQNKQTIRAELIFYSPEEDTYFSVSKEIESPGASPDSGGKNE